MTVNAEDPGVAGERLRLVARIGATLNRVADFADRRVDGRDDDQVWVYAFGADGSDGDADMRNLLGGKGANLAEMSALGLPVPPGFTVTTEVCTYYYAHDRNYPPALTDQVNHRPRRD